MAAFECELCNKQFKNNAGLASHKPSCHSKTFGLPQNRKVFVPQTCNMCQRTLGSPAALANHVKSCKHKHAVNILVKATPPVPTPSPFGLREWLINQATPTASPETVNPQQATPGEPVTEQEPIPEPNTTDPEPTAASDVTQREATDELHLALTNTSAATESEGELTEWEPDTSVNPPEAPTNTHESPVHTTNWNVENIPSRNTLPNGLNRLGLYHIYKLTRLVSRHLAHTSDIAQIGQWTADNHPLHLDTPPLQLPGSDTADEDLLQLHKSFVEQAVEIAKIKTAQISHERLTSNQEQIQEYCDNLTELSSAEDTKELLAVAKCSATAHAAKYLSKYQFKASKLLPDCTTPITFTNPDWYDKLTEAEKNQRAVPKILLGVKLPRRAAPRRQTQPHAQQTPTKAARNAQKDAKKTPAIAGGATTPTARPSVFTRLSDRRPHQRKTREKPPPSARQCPETKKTHSPPPPRHYYQRREHRPQARITRHQPPRRHPHHPTGHPGNSPRFSPPPFATPITRGAPRWQHFFHQTAGPSPPYHHWYPSHLGSHPGNHATGVWWQNPLSGGIW